MEFQDDYEDIAIVNLIYAVESIPTKETEEQLNEFLAEGCQCVDECSTETNCSCTLKYGISYFKSDSTATSLCDNLVLNLEKVKSGIYECNTNCMCKQKCTNRLVQFGPRKYLEIRKCEEKGLGLFTKQKISAGCFICEYAGEIITAAEARKRYTYNKKNKIMNYIICVQEYFGKMKKTTYVDPCYFGNIGRFLNHSCNPNCQLILVRVNSVVPKVCVFSKKEIEENSELTFDYGESNAINGDVQDLKPCLCGEELCRKWMPYCVNIGV